MPSDAQCHPTTGRADGTVALGLETEAVLDTRRLLEEAETEMLVSGWGEGEKQEKAAYGHRNKRAGVAYCSEGPRDT